MTTSPPLTLSEIAEMRQALEGEPDNVPLAALTHPFRLDTFDPTVGDFRYFLSAAQELAELRAWMGSEAVRDVVAERRRQIESEGWSAEHDDKHANGSMAAAAAAYAFNSYRQNGSIGFWPWDVSWWKPKDRRRDLVRAGALIIAEIERLDRLASQPKE